MCNKNERQWHCSLVEEVPKAEAEGGHTREQSVILRYFRDTGKEEEIKVLRETITEIGL